MTSYELKVDLTLDFQSLGAISGANGEIGNICAIGNTFWADVNGDGRDELICFDGASTWTAKSFSVDDTKNMINPEALATLTDSTSKSGEGTWQYQWGHINGDVYADLVLFNKKDIEGADNRWNFDIYIY